MVNGWKYYNHAMIPTTAPHEEVNMAPIKDGSIWKDERKPLLARWTSDFDCGYETSFWYVIKDDVFDISKLKAKRRYEINKGKKNYEARRILPQEYAEELYEVTVDAFFGYPEKYRPNVDKTIFCDNVKGWNDRLVYAAFNRENGAIDSYAWLVDYGSHIDFCVLKSKRNAEKRGVNTAIVEGILSDLNERFTDGFYVCDGTRSTLHETQFQDWLEKYFGFRKAYCKIYLKYKFPLDMVISFAYPFRHRIHGRSKITAQLKAILQMEEFSKESKALVKEI